MSTFLGFACLRSSPKLGGTLQYHARITCVKPLTTVLLEPFAASTRWFSILPTQKPHDSEKTPILSSKYLTNGQYRQPTQLLKLQKRTFFGAKSHNVLTHYVHLPSNYKDEDGLPFQKKPELELKETVRIFPSCSEMTPDRAYRLLKIMHGRRVAGTLEDPSLRKNTAMFSQREINKALEYLRENVPVDEILNAGLRAEDELRQLEVDLVAPKDTETASAVDGKLSEKKAEDPRAVYGVSILDKIRASNTARREAEERAEEEERKRAEELAAQNWGGLTTTAYDPVLHRGLHPQQLEHYEAATSDMEAPPEIPRWRILLPTTVFVAVVLGGLYLLVDRFVPPRPGREVWYDGITEAHVAVAGVVLVNLAMFIAWKRVRLWKFLNQHFILDFVTPRPHQILTAMFTHQDHKHLLKTMFWLCVGGSLLVNEIGPVPFLATYIASGMCGYLATMYTHVARGQLIYMFGASSASFGAVCAYFWLYRFDGFKVLGLPPDPYQGLQGMGIIGLIMSFFALVPMVRRQGGGVDWTSHLVGMLTGIGCASLMEGRWKETKGKAATEEKSQTVDVKKDMDSRNAE